jgi:AraC-like DNA-binding protein
MPRHEADCEGGRIKIQNVHLHPNGLLFANGHTVLNTFETNHTPPLALFLEQLFQILIYGGILLGIFVVLLINNRSVRKSRANIFLSVLLLAITFSIFHNRYAGFVINHFAATIYNVGDPTFLMIAPLLWFYIEELTGSRVTFSIKSFLHFIPALGIIGCSFTFHLITPESTFGQVIAKHESLPTIFFWIVMVIQFSWYQWFIHRKRQAYQRLIKQEVSNTEDVNISWVRFFMVVFLIINVFFLFGLFAVIHLDYTMWLWKGAGVLFSLSIFALGYKGILQREIFFTEVITRPILDEPVAISTKPDQQLIDKAIAYMEQKKPYLDPELSLSNLAKALEMSRSQLSQLINEGVGENFYDFVNKYRVEEVKRLMTDFKAKNFNLYGIALEAGFKSKSTFNLIFKRFTGLTPTEYRKNIGK